MITGQMLQRVHNGAQWLDSVMPGWAGKVNLAELDMAQCLHCMLGQVKPLDHDYYWYMDNKPFNWDVIHGFAAGLTSYRALTDLWAMEVRARL